MEISIIVYIKILKGALNMRLPKTKIKVLRELAKRGYYLVKTIEYRELRHFNCRYLVMNEDDKIVGAYNNLMDILRDYEEEEAIK